MVLQVIKTEEQHREALATLEQLMISDPALKSDEASTLEVLSVLIEKYETENVQFDPVDPIEAIKFRMDQQNLTNRGLEPYIGVPGKVSEIMNGKRPLSLKMIRALHKGLGISYDTLMAEPKADLEDIDIDWQQFPLNEMLNRELFTGTSKLTEIKIYAEENVTKFFGSRMPVLQAAFHRIGKMRSGRAMNNYALAVWHTLALQSAEKTKLAGTFDLDALNAEFFEDLAKLSAYEEGPSLAKEYLSRHGIHLTFVAHFKKTYLDGAALKLEDGTPIIAMTLRHDRLDNFWFVLMHELAHIKLHLYNDSTDAIYDDLDVEDQSEIEQQADDTAGTSLIPSHAWEEVKHLRSTKEVRNAARKYNRHPAIFAGRLRKDLKNYRLFNGLIGRGETKELLSA